MTPCRQCAHESNSVARFCIRCGARLERSAASAEPDEQREKRSGTSRLGLPFATAAALLLLATTVIALLPRTTFYVTAVSAFLTADVNSTPGVPLSVGDCIQMPDYTREYKRLRSCRKGEEYYVVKHVLPAYNSCPRTYYTILRGPGYTICLEATR